MDPDMQGFLPHFHWQTKTHPGRLAKSWHWHNHAAFMRDSTANETVRDRERG